ncbi:unnamed protein product [Phytomonas sp. Hart1]|nr:unnamed protein product [Phytomonas sp. Hart1]|eukprot:CCW69364.1 unnamed protein product [Phytomonas sp. isolate Hart1]
MPNEQSNKYRRVESGKAKPTTKELLETSVSQGPFSVLESSMKDGIQVFIQCRFNKSLLANVLAFDKHFNMVLQNVVELSGNDKAEQKERTIRNLFLRGESVIFVVKLKNETE